MATHEELTIKLGMMQALFNEAMDRADKAEARVMGLELALKSLHVAVDEMISTPGGATDRGRRVMRAMKAAKALFE